MNTFAILALASLAGLAGGASAQEKAYTPLSGKAFEEALNRLLPPHQAPGKSTRFVITLRYLPPWGAESQISIAYDVNSKGKVVLWTLQKPLGETLNGFLRNGGKESDLVGVVPTIQVTKAELEIGRKAAREILAGLWGAVAGMAKEAPEFALKHDGTPEMEIVLDATLYQAFYTDAANYIEVSATGPDPERVRNPDDLDSLVRWMLNIRHQFVKVNSPPPGPRQ